MSYTGQTNFADMFEYYCNRNVTNGREYNEREMLRWLKQKLEQVHRDATEEVAKAHKRGWEQCQREAKSNILDHFTCCDFSHGCDHDWCNMLKEIADAIAAMEYKGGNR